VTTLFPGAKWVPIPGQEKRAARRKGRGVGYHVAVYVGPSIEKIDESTGNDSHLYVRFDGSVEQNVDLDLISYAGVDGNSSMIWVETEGGANPATVETEPWTPAQVATLARILRWAHDTEGVPLQLMPDSRPASRGAGWHKQGVDPWRVTGGEVWSTHYGKVCPGAAKIAQVPQIVALAQNPDQPTEDDMPRFDLIRNSDNGLMVLAAPGIWRGLSNAGYVKLVASMGLVKSTTPDVDAPTNEFAFLQSVYLSGVAAQLDPAAVAAAVVAALPPGGTPVDVDALAAKVVDDLLGHIKS
jgi:hypothetical protein